MLSALRESQGTFLHVDEHEIKEGQRSLAQLGIYVELTSALIWGGLLQLPPDTPQPLVCIITGHGLKSA